MSQPTSAQQAAQQIESLITKLDQDIMILDRHLKEIAFNVRIPVHLSTRRLPVPNGSWTQPAINLPKATRFIFIQQFPQTAVLLVGWGETDNLQEQPPGPSNYTTLGASTNGRWYEGRGKGTLFLQSNTASTVVEIDLWG